MMSFLRLPRMCFLGSFEKVYEGNLFSISLFRASNSPVFSREGEKEKEIGANMDRYRLRCRTIQKEQRTGTERRTVTTLDYVRGAVAALHLYHVHLPKLRSRKK
jgi:hypothetical protein